MSELCGVDLEKILHNFQKWKVVGRSAVEKFGCWDRKTHFIRPRVGRIHGKTNTQQTGANHIRQYRNVANIFEDYWRSILDARSGADALAQD